MKNKKSLSYLLGLLALLLTACPPSGNPPPKTDSINLEGKICPPNDPNCSMCVRNIVEQVSGAGHLDISKPKRTFAFPHLRRGGPFGSHVQGVTRLRDSGDLGRMILSDNNTNAGFRVAVQDIEDADEALYSTSTTLRDYVPFDIRDEVAFGDLNHPGGIQAHGDLVAVAMENEDKNPKHASIYFLRVTGSNTTFINRVNLTALTSNESIVTQNNAASVGFVQLANGRFLVAAQGNAHTGRKGIWFYLSSNTDINSGTTWSFLDFYSPSCQSFGNTDDSCFVGAQGGLNLVTDCTGKIYLLAMDGTDGSGGDEYEYLQIFQLTKRVSSIALEKVVQQREDLGLAAINDHSFRWAGGAFVSKNGQLALMNTERRVSILEGFIDGDVYYGTCWRFTITNPHNGASFAVGDTVSLDGEIRDPDGALHSPFPGYWISDRDGRLGNDSVTRVNNLSIGTHKISLETTRSCITGNSVEITITGSASINITSPSDGSNQLRGRAISFRVNALGYSEPPLVSWHSSLDGTFATSTDSVFSRDLSLGNHTITASTPAPGGGNTLQDQINITVANEPPVVTIIEPNPDNMPLCANAPINFRARVFDPIAISFTTIPNANIVWEFNSTAFGTGREVSHSFPVVEGTMRVRATDVVGDTGQASMSFSTQTCVDFPPEVEIIQPVVEDTEFTLDRDDFDEDRGMWYKDVLLTGQVTDVEDGILTGDALVWTTNQTAIQDAILGTGTTITARLYKEEFCFGQEQHIITLTATDSGDQSTPARRIIFIQGGLC